MLPRKRQRPNPANFSSSSVHTDTSTHAGAQTPVNGTEAASTSQSEQTSDPVAHNPQHHMPPTKEQHNSHDKLAGKGGIPAVKEVRKTQSWYGSWPRTPKASALTSVARENIFGGSAKPEKAPDLSRFDSNKDGDIGSVRSTAASFSGAATNREAHQNTSEMGTNEGRPPAADGVDTGKDVGNGKDAEDGKAEDKTSNPNESSAPLQTTGDDQNTETTAEENNTNPPQRPVTSSGWLGWWSKTPFTDSQASVAPPVIQSETPIPNDIPRPATPPAQTPQVQPDPTEQSQEAPRSASWFGFWSSNNPSVNNGESEQGDKPTEGKESEQVGQQINSSEDVVMSDAPPATQQQNPEPAPKAGSTWAFWSRDSPKSHNKTSEGEAGEIAVIGEGSEAHPKPMTEGDVTPTKDAKSRKDNQANAKSTWRRNNKRLRPASMDIEAQSQSASGSSTPNLPSDVQQQTNQSLTPAKADPSSKSIAESESSSKTQANLLLPSFESTYEMKQDPSILKQVAQFLLRTQQPPVNHVLRLKDTPQIKKAISIGIHGLMPAMYLRPMIGQPTGTSLRFANLGADAIRRWADSHGSPNCEIEKVALEGEGKISDRVDNLWKLMLNWIEHIRKADLILISCHSQGVPVSIMLLEKLIDLGIITNAKIGVCAMAGVSLGPFSDYKSGILMGAAAELWDFGNPESANALRFETSLKRVLDYGARITFVGSIDDQLVPMESAVYSPANHPHIYRAVFIDGRVHAPDFIAHLVGFALKLRNLGVSDHGLIRELSLPLAGSLYSGEGHSRLYYDDQVYDLAVSHALETTSAPPRQACEIHHRKQGTILGAQQQQSNPYVLPWIMRGLLEEDFVKTQLSHETEELLKQFDEWKPSNKALKDVKYRLEAVRSKL